MYSIIVGTHGDLAKGFKDTMTMIIGEQEDVYFLNFKPSESVEEFEKKVNVIYHSIEDTKQILFMVDILGGTPCNVVNKLKLKYGKRIEIVTGLNLPMLMSAVLLKNQDLSEGVNQLLGEGRYGITKIDLNKTINEDDE